LLPTQSETSDRSQQAFKLKNFFAQQSGLKYKRNKKARKAFGFAGLSLVPPTGIEPVSLP
jgi:hypothetical protein